MNILKFDLPDNIQLYTGIGILLHNKLWWCL